MLIAKTAGKVFMMQKGMFGLLRRAVFLCVALFMVLPGRSFAEATENAVDLSGGKSCSLAEMNTLTPVMQKETDTKMNVAGLARLPVLLYVCEAFDKGILTEKTVITVSEEAAAVPGPTAFVRPFEKIEAGVLLKAAVMILAGDAITALAETAAGTGEAAAAAVNERLGRLGILQQFNSICEANGLFSADELLILGKELAQSKTFCSLSTVFLDEIIHENGNRTELVNQNRLLKNVSGCFGIATGSSEEAGYCGIFGVKRGGGAYLCVTLGAENANSRFETAREMIEYAFAAYRTTKITSAGEIVSEGIPVQGGIREKTDLVSHKDAVILEKVGETYERKLRIPETLQAPLFKDVSVGSIFIANSAGEKVMEIPIYPAETVEAAAVFDYVRKIMVRWVHG